uniref:Proline and serine rich 2 n=1 Tax=Sander lucioperca TaxID=283035 RepID=A0A8C9XNU4_SANLU
YCYFVKKNNSGTASSSPSKSVRPMLAESCSGAGLESDLLPFAVCRPPSLSPFHVCPLSDDTLQFLSKEEKECIQFFENTIDSLEDSLEENDRRPVQVKTPASSSPIVSSLLTRPPSPKDQDIIYLVRPEPDLGQNKEPIFNPTNPGSNPESHFETRPRRDQVDSLPSEYNPPLPSGSYGSTDSHYSYHPPGCIPTPVLIAQQIAENQAGGTSNFHPSSFLRRNSQESDKPLSHSGDLKHGPATSAKPTRFPANISVIHGNKEHQNQPLANVNLNDRRAQMLANLTGTSNPLLQEDPQPALEQEARNTPTRKPLPTELNSYGGKSRTFNPSTGLNRPSDSPGKSFKAPAPAPAPKPTRQSYHGAVSTQKPAVRASSPEPRRRSTSMFRPQGITVQFSGRGATDESRRDALRKLGLLKDS